MSRMLSQLLNAEEPTFSLAIKQLEELSGLPSADVRLTAEIIGKVQLKTKELGLDPVDTDGEELFHALVNKIGEHDKHLVKQIGGKDPNDFETLMPLMKKAWQKADTQKSAWVLKKSVAKKMLRQNPPKNIMKHLHYRSLESMLKNENIGEIYGALRFAQSADWLNEFNKDYKDLRPGDFETRLIEVIEMPPQRWADLVSEFIYKKKHNITHVKEMGVIIMLPIPKDAKLRGITIFALPLLFHYLNEIRLYSSFFKLKQVQPDFGKIVVDTLIANTAKAATVAGQNIHWRVIQRYFARLEHEKHPEIFQPHVQPEDLHWRRAEEMLYEIDPELGFWRDLDYVGAVHGKRALAFNMLDVAASYVNQLPYSKRAVYHFSDSLWNEIFSRYMGQRNLEEQILDQLDNDMIEPEDIDLEAV